ncbi:MAG TPA: LysE family transporter, partial [Bacteroidales bacterium]|nr:LysE family transporter [Bacteroidales bacterium]
MNIILNGIITGLLLSTLIGATFFMLIETSMTRGFRVALWFEAGVVLCDALIITGIYFFASWITNTLINNQYFNIAGGIVFMAFGVNYIFSRKKAESETLSVSRNIRTFANGFFINLMNPSVLLFWMGTMAVSLTNFGYNGKQVFFYYLSILIIMILFDVLKAYFAYRLSGLIHSKVLKIIYVFSG